MAQKIASGPYAGPEGPYKSQWATHNLFVVRTPDGYSTITNGEQVKDGIVRGSLQDARNWLRENGYSL